MNNNNNNNNNNYDALPLEKKILALQLFNQLLQNEQQKAMQAVQAFATGSLFGGTSVTALVRKPFLPQSLHPQGLEELAEAIADSYVAETRNLKPHLERAFTSTECELFLEHGLFYGVHVSPKLIALSEGLVVEHKDLLLEGFPEPYQLPKQAPEIIKEYFVRLKEERGLDLDLSSLVLADTTVPAGFEGKKILNPSNLNVKLSRLSSLITDLIKQKSVNVDALYLVSTDTDSPHRLLLSENKKPLEGYPLTPGLTMCGSTASIEGFDFLYVYRIGLIAQMIGNNIISSRMQGNFSPFTFVGMLSPFGYKNGAIPTGRMGDERYSGNLDLRKEFLFQYKSCIGRMMDS